MKVILYIFILSIFSTIHSVIAQVNAVFNVSKSNICQDESIVVTHTNITNVKSWKWNFGTDAFPDSTTAQGPHVISYSSSGTKTIRLTVSDGVNTNTRTATINVSSKPSAAFTVTGNFNTIPTTLTFNSTVNNVGFNYDFGDKFSGVYNGSNSPYNTRRYDYGGNYFACLTTTNNGTSCSNTECKEIIINAGNNTIKSNFNVSPSKSTCVGNLVSLSDLSIGASTSRSWDFGLNASPASSTAINPPAVSWSTPGYKTIVLRYGSGTNNNNIKISSVLFEVNPYPIANFEIEGNNCQTPATITLRPQVQPGYIYQWDLGNGTTSNSVSPSVTYNTSGKKNITLSITKDGCTTVYSRQIEVGNCTNTVKPSFNVSSSLNECLSKKYTFNYTGLSASSYLWNFGSGAVPATSTSSNPVVTYSTPGPHSVTLTINGNESVTGIIK